MHFVSSKLWMHSWSMNNLVSIHCWSVVHASLIHYWCVVDPSTILINTVTFTIVDVSIHFHFCFHITSSTTSSTFFLYVTHWILHEGHDTHSERPHWRTNLLAQDLWFASPHKKTQANCYPHAKTYCDPTLSPNTKYMSLTFKYMHAFSLSLLTTLSYLSLTNPQSSKLGWATRRQGCLLVSFKRNHQHPLVGNKNAQKLWPKYQSQNRFLWRMSSTAASWARVNFDGFLMVRKRYS